MESSWLERRQMDAETSQIPTTLLLVKQFIQLNNHITDA